MPLHIEEIPLGDPKLKTFVEFPWQIYKGDPCWTPPLRGDLLGNRLLGLQGILTPKHPYHKHADVTHFLAWNGDKPVGRISASINHRFNEYHNTHIGSFGFFELINDFEVAQVLLDNARKWVEKRGMTLLRGPGEYSNATHERQGILIDGFQYPPTVELTHNYPYYAELLERYGFRKAKDYVAYLAEQDSPAIASMKTITEQLKKRGKIKTRSVIIKNLNEEVRLIVEIYNKAWADNWGFLPLTDDDADAIADSLRLIIDPGLVRFAFINDEPAAVLGVIPDPNYALRPRWHWYGDSDLIRIARLLYMRRRIPHTRAMFFGIVPQYRDLGIDALLFHESIEYGLSRGYIDTEASMLLEDNCKILQITKYVQAKHYKTWRIYDLPLK